MARVVVTGGAGFLGSHLCEQLLARGDQVVALDNLITGNLANIEHLFGERGFTFVEQDVSSYVWVPGPVEAVLHFASPASPKDYLEMPIQTLKVGSLGTHNTLGLAKAKSARYLLASTSEVYGDPQVHPQPESYWGNVNPVGPRGVYDEAKRFAEAMTMAYHRYHGLDVRIVRIFNSILADEQVVYDDGTQLRRETVAEAAARLGTVDLDGCHVPAFTTEGTAVSGEASALVGHPCRTPCYEVRTRYGRSIRVTGDHSLFVEGPDGRPLAKAVRDLGPHDAIAVARRIRVPERDRSELDVVEILERAGRSAWDLQVYAEGLGELAWERRQEVFGALATFAKPTSLNWRNTIWSRIRRMREQDAMPLGALRRLGTPVPHGALVGLYSAGRTAKLPTRIAVTDELLWLLGLYVAEGCWQHQPPKSAIITLSADEELLGRARKVVERELGLDVVWSHPNDTRSASMGVHSVLLLDVLGDLGFGPGPKSIPGWVLGLPLRRLGWFLEGYREGDGVHSGKKLDEGVRHEFSTTSDALKDDLLVALARFGLVPSVGRYQTTFKQRHGDRRFPFWRLTLAAVAPWSPLDWHRGVSQTLQARTTDDLVWARVREVVEVEPTELVYDFCVPGLENFVAGTGVMAHNTYGPRMRPQDGRVVSNFLVQALQGKPLTIYGDGTQTRSFCFVDDEVRGILALLDSDWVGPCNIGNPGEFTMLELAQLVLEVTGSSSEIVHEPLPVDDPTQRQPDLTIARRELGWSPEVSLREGLERTAPYFRRVLEL